MDEELVGTVGVAIAQALDDQGVQLSPPQIVYVALKAIEASGLEQLHNRVEMLEGELRDLLADPESVSRQADARAALTESHNG